MKFIDEAVITVQSGKGGSGCVSFRREKYIPRGGPDGGDGGKGGDVVLKAVPGKRTLLQFRYRRQFKAQNGSPGQGKQKTGRNGGDLVIEVPPGTVVSDPETGRIIVDLTRPYESFVVARGGRGGQGNLRFKTSTHRTPRFAQPGEAGETFVLKLELKLLADVGIVGLPNAGKSTLISTISAARPKIGDYPFTTLTPSLGVVDSHTGEPFVAADIPGLVEGAHAGTGLGIRFLKHIERTRLLVHLIDTAAIDPDDPLSGYRTVNRELASHSEALGLKPQVVVLNKMDITGTEDLAQAFEKAVGGPTEVLRISAASRKGIPELIRYLRKRLDTMDEPG